MSYSDYGGFAWRNGERFPEAIDATLTGVVAPKERPLEQQTGMKLDVLLPFFQKDEKERDYLTDHPHHCVLGTMKGLAIVAHKQSMSIVWNGKVIDNFPKQEDRDDNGCPTVLDGHWEREGWKARTRYIHYNHSEGVMFVLLTPDGTVLSGVSGYGIGDHWWKDEEGFEMEFDDENHEVIGRKGNVPWADENSFKVLVDNFTLEVRT